MGRLDWSDTTASQKTAVKQPQRWVSPLLWSEIVTRSPMLKRMIEDRSFTRLASSFVSIIASQQKETTFQFFSLCTLASTKNGHDHSSENAAVLIPSRADLHRPLCRVLWVVLNRKSNLTTYYAYRWSPLLTIRLGSKDYPLHTSFCDAVMLAEGGGPREGAILLLTPQPPQQATRRASGIKGRSPARRVRAAHRSTRTRPERTARSAPRAPQRSNRPPQTGSYRTEVQQVEEQGGVLVMWESHASARMCRLDRNDTTALQKNNHNVISPYE
ncbi:unnamed protein product [Spodoptera exigua]|nr:unnamed protein product [Spodoptera exigua]